MTTRNPVRLRVVQERNTFTGELTSRFGVHEVVHDANDQPTDVLLYEGNPRIEWTEGENPLDKLAEIRAALAEPVITDKLTWSF